MSKSRRSSTRPRPHTCSSDAAKFLRPIEYAGGWYWELRALSDYRELMLVSYCPWCACQLPVRPVKEQQHG